VKHACENPAVRKGTLPEIAAAPAVATNSMSAEEESMGQQPQEDKTARTKRFS